MQAFCKNSLEILSYKTYEREDKIKPFKDQNGGVKNIAKMSK